jgi:hypothetical protein
MNTNTEYETHDIYLGAYISMSLPMLKKRRQGSRVFFVFENINGKIQELRDQYYTGKCLVPANAYARKIQDFKELCFDP